MSTLALLSLHNGLCHASTWPYGHSQVDSELERGFLQAVGVKDVKDLRPDVGEEHKVGR